MGGKYFVSLIFSGIVGGMVALLAVYFLTPGNLHAMNGGRVLEASSVLIKDPNGRVQAGLVSTGSGAKLDFFARNGDRRMTVGMTTDGPTLEIMGFGQTKRIKMAVQGGNPGVHFFNPRGEKGIEILTDDHPLINWYGENKKKAMSAGVNETTPSLRMLDKKASEKILMIVFNGEDAALMVQKDDRALPELINIFRIKR